MAEVLIKFTEPVVGTDGTRYEAQACGGLAADGLWEGWIEFTNGGETSRTGRETEQPNLADLQYWAGGLTKVYLQGALTRARESVVDRALPVSSPPGLEGAARRPEPPPPMSGRPVLNPFLVYAEGPDLLRHQLHALSRDQLGVIVAWYGLPMNVDLRSSSAGAIADDIVQAIREGRRKPRTRESGAGISD